MFVIITAKRCIELLVFIMYVCMAL